MKRLLNLVLLCCFISSSVFSQWFWQNPKPQGNSLQSVCFINQSEGWACGSNGTIIHSANGGASWNIQPANLLATLNSVFFINSTHGWIAGSFPNSWELILKTTDGGTTWNTVLNAANNSPLRDIFFVDVSTGWAVGSSGEVKYTLDGGLTWYNKLIPNIQNQSLGCIFFQDPLKGWIVGSNGTILKTNDGGLSWISVVSPTTKSLNSICFSSLSTGTICGENGTVLSTQDGGANWVEKASGTTGNLSQVSFASQDTGIITGAVILKSVDAGISWHVVNSTCGYISGCFPGPQVAYGVGYCGHLVKSDDGGVNWYDLSSGTNKPEIRDSFFADAQSGWLLENGNRILFTGDGGETWEGIDTTAFFSDRIVFTDLLNGWSAGFGQIAHTADGGHSWTVQFLDPGHTLFLRDLAFTDPLHGWAVGTDTILRTTNGGITWDKLHVGPISPYAIFFADQNTGWIVGDAGKIMKTTDGGVTWTPKSSGTNAELHDVTFTGLNHGWAVGHRWTSGYTSVVLHTTNGGESWNSAELPGGQWLYSVTFPDSLNGWICGSYGTIFHTQDGGINWDRQANLTDNYLYTICFTDKNTGWATGGYGTILKTTTGGIVGLRPHDITSTKEMLSVSPNPASSIARISYRVEKTSEVHLTLYDVSGFRIRDLVNAVQRKGSYTIAVDFSSLPRGLYFCRFTSNGYSEIKKIVVAGY